jgi:hypothetical protein
MIEEPGRHMTSQRIQRSFQEIPIDPYHKSWTTFSRFITIFAKPIFDIILEILEEPDSITEKRTTLLEGTRIDSQTLAQKSPEKCQE